MALVGVILSILFASVAGQAGCTSYTTSGTCGADDACNWKPGKCSTFKAQDCTLPDCPLGCIYTASVPGSCENVALEQCTGVTSENCAAEGDGTICELGDGTCVSNNPSVTCPAEIDDIEECPGGCVDDVYTAYCELAPTPQPVNHCDGYSTVPGPSQCQNASECQVSSSGSCVRNPSVPTENWCSELGTAICSQESEGYCKISNGQCVVADENAFCSSLSTTRLSNCESAYYGCKVSDGKCVELTADDRCSKYKVSGGVSPCENDDYCKVSSGFCVFDSSAGAGEGEDWCSELGTAYCIAESGGDCKIVNGNCVRAHSVSSEYTKYCRELSTIPITECGSHSADCKVSGNKCVGLTADEKCSVYGVVAHYSECDLNHNCERPHEPEGEGEGEGEGDFPHGDEGYNGSVNGSGPHGDEGYNGSVNGSVPHRRLHAIRNADGEGGDADTCVVNSYISYVMQVCSGYTNVYDCVYNSPTDYDCDWVDGETEGTGICKSGHSRFQEVCSSLSTTLTITDCERYSGGTCGVNSNGACVSLSPVTPDCKLNQGKTRCENPAGCVFYSKKSCKKKVCDGYFSRAECLESQYFSSYSESDPYGSWVKYCSWETTGTDSCKPVTSCDVEDDGSCHTVSSGCQSTSVVNPICAVDSSIVCNKATVSECNGVSGCKWNSTDGGVCEQKTCASSPSYTRCCPSNEANCAYCSGVNNKPSDCPYTDPGNTDPGTTDPNTDTKCTKNPSYSNCCPGSGCDLYCSLFADDSKCADRATSCGSNPGDSVCAGFCTSDPNGSICDGYCKSHPDESICASKNDDGASSHIFAPFIALLLLLILL